MWNSLEERNLAIIETIMQELGVSDIEELPAKVHELKEAAEQSGAGDGLHSCFCGDRIPLDEYRCSNCRAWETTRA